MKYTYDITDREIFRLRAENEALTAKLDRLEGLLAEADEVARHADAFVRESTTEGPMDHGAWAKSCMDTVAAVARFQFGRKSAGALLGGV